MKFDYTIQEVITALDHTDEVYVEIAKDTMRQFYDIVHEIPCNGCGEPDESYVCGEIQFIFEKGTDNLAEILLFPVYEEEGDGLVNGDFIRLSEEICDNRDLINAVKAKLNFT